METAGGYSPAYPYGRQILYTVECHGRRQVVHLNESDLVNLPPGATASFGIAFQEEAACKALGEGMQVIASQKELGPARDGMSDTIHAEGEEPP